MGVPPYPSVPSPTTFSSGPLTSKALRDNVADVANYVANRPLFQARCTTAPNMASGSLTNVGLDTTETDTWCGHDPSGSNNPFYYCQSPGWHVVEAVAPWNYTSTTGVTFTSAIESVVGGTTTTVYGESQTFNSGYMPAPIAGDLVKMTHAGTVGAASGVDYVGLYVMQDSGSSIHLMGASPAYPRMSVRWVAASSGTTGLSVPSNPAWPSPSTSLTDSPSAGATSITVASATGMTAGGYLRIAPLSSNAETVTITSVSGLTIGVSALAHSHSSGATVDVPVSSAFADVAITDTARFLLYPPIFRAYANSPSQSLGLGQTWPTPLTIALDTVTVDNYSGWSSANNQWTAPVAGVYWVYAQAACTVNAASTLAVGVTVNSTTYWVGNSRASTVGQDNYEAGTARLRLNAGDTVSLGAYSSSSFSESIVGASYGTRLCVVWESS